MCFIENRKYAVLRRGAIIVYWPLAQSNLKKDGSGHVTQLANFENSR